MGGKSKGKAPKASRKTVQKAAISTGAKIAGGGMAGIVAAKTMAAAQEKAVSAKKAGKKEKKKKTILRTLGDSIKKIVEGKVKSDIEKGEKLLRKGMGAITVFNIAAETAKEYEKKLGEVLLNIGEGLKTAAAANVESQIERAEKLEEESRKRNVIERIKVQNKGSEKQ